MAECVATFLVLLQTDLNPGPFLKEDLNGQYRANVRKIVKKAQDALKKGTHLTGRDTTIWRLFPADAEGKHKAKRGHEFLACMVLAGFGTLFQGQKKQLIFSLNEQLDDFCLSCLQR